MDLREQILPVTPSEVVEFDQLTPTTGGVVFTPDTPATTDILYVSTVDASTWIYNGSSYITYTVSIPSVTPFYLLGTEIDAGGNKTANIERIGQIKATSFKGNGAQVSSLNATNISSGTVNVARLGTGSAGAGAKVLADNNTWITPSAGGLTKFTEAESTTSPNATVNVDSLTAIASTTDADISIVPKGSGAFLLAIPDNTTTGGNKRGTGAVDLQMSRVGASQVSSGVYSNVLGGRENTSSGAYSICLGGYSNSSSSSYAISGGLYATSTGTGSVALGLRVKATNDGAVSLGGSAFTDNTASGVNSVAIGDACTSSSTNSVAIGKSNTASGQYSLAIGFNSSTFSIVNKLSFGALQFSSIGDNQLGELVLSNSTTDTTVTTLTSNRLAAGATNQLVLQNQQVISFEGKIQGKQSGSTNIGVWKIDGTIVRGANAGSTTLVVSNVTLVTNASGWGTPTLTADTTNGGLKVEVSGLSATNIKWNCRIDSIELINA